MIKGITKYPPKTFHIMSVPVFVRTYFCVCFCVCSTTLLCYATQQIFIFFNSLKMTLYMFQFPSYADKNFRNRGAMFECKASQLFFSHEMLSNTYESYYQVYGISDHHLDITWQLFYHATIGNITTQLSSYLVP